jgi:DNA topoisomerase-1
VVSDPVKSAKVAGLRYVSDTGPGIQRIRVGEEFTYIGLDGKPLGNAEELQRIRALAIPLAWTDVWICPIPDGHLQATGRDSKGRKQYRYHARWREIRDATKYNRMIAFGQALPLLRKQVDAGLSRPGLPREKVLATVVKLLETTLIRVGNTEYARHNRSFGLTTMRDRHVEIAGSNLRFVFRGKGGKQYTVDIKDRRLARIVKRCQDIPGHELFQYIDDAGQRQMVDSSDVNEYLREITGQDFTAKDFRTWAGTMLAALALQEFEQFDTQAQAKKNIVQAIERVAEWLGNTPSICRKCYIHPEVIDAYMEGSLLEVLKQRAEQALVESLSGLSSEEGAVLAFLQQRLSREQAAAHYGSLKAAK